MVTLRARHPDWETSLDAIEEYKQDVLDAVEGIPFTQLDVPEFVDLAYAPKKVRQQRRYGRPDSSTQPITRYLTERGMVDILSSEDTVALFEEIHWCCDRLRILAAMESTDVTMWKDASTKANRLIQRMSAAEEELFIANRQLVVACVKPFYWIGQVWIPDFLQEGSKALANAIRKFDYTRGVPFYAYAQRSIQNRLRNFFRDHIRTGALGIKPSQDMTNIRDCMVHWRDHKNGDNPSLEVIAEVTDISIERIKRLLPLVKQWERMPAAPLSLDMVLGDSRSSLHDLIEDHHQESAAVEVEKKEIWVAVSQLPDRMQRILKMRFVEGRTFEEVGEAFGLSRARIKQIQDEALEKLRAVLRQTRAG